MKYVLTIMALIISHFLYSQSIGYFRYDSIRFEKVGGNAEFILLNSTRGVTGGVLTNLGNGRTGFVTPSGGVGGLSGGNLGAGFRIYVPSSQGVKTLFNSYGFNWDSTSNANGLTGIIDSTLFSTRAWRQKGLDSLGAIKQPLDADLTAIAGLSPSNDDIIQRKAGAWTNRTIAQLKTDLSLSGTNTGDQTISLTGDATGSGTGSIAVTLASVVTAGSCTSCNLTYDAKGRITVAANGSGGAASITVGSSTLTGGTNTRVPFNDGGVYNEDAGIAYNKTSDVLTLGGSLALPNSGSSLSAITLGGSSFLTNYGPSNDNTALGKDAGSLSSTASNRLNVAIGYGAGKVVQSQQNTFIGDHAGETFTAAADPANDGSNVFIGSYAGGTDATGTRNSVFIGVRAGESVITGSYSNVGIGKFTLEKCTTCAANAMLGASINLTTGINNSAIGADILVDGTSASYNSLAGMFSHSHTTTGSYNISSGYFSAYNNTTGNSNVALGDHANYTNVTGNNNIGIGAYALAFNTSDDYMFSVHSGNGGTFGKALIGGDLQNIKACIGCREDSIKLWASTLAVIGNLRVTHQDSTSSPQNMAYLDQEGYLKIAAVPSTSSAIASGTTSVTSGTDTRVFFQDGTVISQDAGFVYNKTSNILTIDGVNIGRGTAGEVTNTAVGNGAGNAWTTATNSAAFGYQALNVTTTGTGTSGFGYRALASNTTGAYNHAFGLQALESNVTGNYNTAVGAQALRNNTNNNGVAVGFQALLANTSGSQNTGLGYAALSANTTGSTNTAIGYNSGLSNTTGSNNTYVGYGTTGPTTQSGNTVLGAGINIGTVSNNIAIGNGTGTIYARHDGTDWEFTGRIGNTKTTEQMRLKYDASNYLTTTVSSTGSTTFDLVGTTPVLTLADSINAPLLSQTAIDTATWKIVVKNKDNHTVKTMAWAYAGTGGGMTNPLTTTGDIIYSSSGTTAARLGIGTTGQSLRVVGGIPTWSAVDLSSSANVTGVLGVANGGGVSSSYTPTLTEVTNITGGSTSNHGTAQYYRMSGNFITVWGELELSAAAGSTFTTIDISLPVASNFTSIYDAKGTCTSLTIGAMTPGFVRADATNDRATLSFWSLGASGHNILYQFSYELK
jgi:hypothetical protein